MAIPEQKQTQQELTAQLADLTETMEREKVTLSSEVKRYFNENMARFSEQMTKGEMPNKQELEEFIEKIKRWMKMPKRFREQRPSIEQMENPEYRLTKEQKEELLSTLKTRFEANMIRHKGIEWVNVEARLNAANTANPEKLWSLNEMEVTGGEPDVVGYGINIGEFEFFDCSAESPIGRRNICYDREGQKEAEKRGEKPAGNAVDMAEEMRLGGILNENQYRNKLQTLGNYDMDSWSWIQTPADKRRAGVALSADRGGDGVVYVHVYFPSDPDVYGAFRGWLRV